MRFPVLLCVLALPLRAAGAEMTLESLLAEVGERNPEVLAARAAARGAAARVSPARTWPDPTFSYSQEKLPDGSRMNRLGVEQEVPFPGKLSREGVMVRHEALIRDAEARAKSLAAAAEARSLYFQLYRSDRWIPLLEKNVAAVSALTAAMTARAAADTTGDGAAADALSLRAELGRMENMLDEEKGERKILAYRLNALRDRSVTDEAGSLSAPALKSLPLTLAAALRSAETQSPLYHQARHMEAHANAMKTRALLGYLPDFSIMYKRETGDGGMTGREAGVGLKIPLWLSRPAGAAREAEAHLDEAQAMGRMWADEALKMAAMEYTETGIHLRQARRYETDILPAAEGAWRVTRRRYESGRGDVVRLLEALRGCLSAEREYYDELYHYAEHWGQLERWIGVPLEEAGHE